MGFEVCSSIAAVKLKKLAILWDLATTQLRDLEESAEREKTNMAGLAMYLYWAFPLYHGNPTKDRSFANFLSDYKLACDRFGFD